MENVSLLKDVIFQGDYLVKLDLKDAYLTVPINNQDWKFLRFTWKGIAYEFTVLPFGLATAPCVFTKLLHPVVASLRRQGIRLLIFLDDILIAASSRAKAAQHITLAMEHLNSLGFITNEKKSITTPSQIMEFLGFVVNTAQMTLTLPTDKVLKLRKECKHMMNQPEVTARQLAHLIGLMTSTIPAVLPAPLWYRALQRLRFKALVVGKTYDHPTRMTQEAMADLRQWLDCLSLHNGRPIHPQDAAMILESDASN